MSCTMTCRLLFFNLGGPELFLIFLVLLLLFGGKKIPELMKGLGKGIKSFKEGMNEVEKDIKADPSDASSAEKKQENGSSAPTEGAKEQK